MLTPDELALQHETAMKFNLYEPAFHEEVKARENEETRNLLGLGILDVQKVRPDDGHTQTDSENLGFVRLSQSYWWVWKESFKNRCLGKDDGRPAIFNAEVANNIGETFYCSYLPKQCAPHPYRRTPLLSMKQWSFSNVSSKYFQGREITNHKNLNFERDFKCNTFAVRDGRRCLTYSGCEWKEADDTIKDHIGETKFYKYVRE